MKFKNLILLVLIAIAISTNLSSCNKAQTPVQKHGQLSINKNLIVNQNGTAVQLSGMSLFWSNWIGKYYNPSCIKWLKDEWKCSVIRASMGVKGNQSGWGYLTESEQEFAKIKAVVDACIKEEIYVIIDWHDHHAEMHEKEAVEFFNKISAMYGSYPNVIYEIYNEPLNVSWNDVIKPYSEKVIAAIRLNDPDNIIICGTSNWSQNVDEASLNPIDDKNTAYSLHFYAGTHQKWLRDMGDQAMKNGICLFVTEYGTTEANGDGPVFIEETNAWYNWMKKNKISHCNWSIADKNESSAALTPDADSLGGWTQNQIKESGKLVQKELAKNWDILFQ